MRGGEGLVQVELDHVRTHMPGFRHPHERVQIGTVHVDQSAMGVEQGSDLQDLPLKQSQGVGIGHHECGDFSIDESFHGRRFQ